jgi:hypothetical protein
MRRRRGRPLLRTAIVGGVAYSAGSKSAQNAQREADQNARIDDMESQQQAPAPAEAAPAPAGMSADAITRLQQLAQLKEQGVLTEAEFDAEKQKILQGT